MTEFEPFFNAVSTGKILELELTRKQFVKDFWKFFLIFLLLTSVAFLSLLVLPKIGIFVGVGLALVACVVLIVKTHRFSKNQKIAFKSQIVPELVHQIDNRLHYSTASVLLASYFESQLFLGRVDRHKTEDQIVGLIEKTEIKFSELHTEQKRVSYDSKGNRKETWATLFKGIFFEADFHKDFQGQTFIDPDYSERSMGRFGKFLQKLSSGRSQKLIRMENPQFEKFFKIHGTDEQEARYILSLSLQERLIQMREKMGVDPHISFVNSKVFVAYPTDHDFFEPTLFKSLVSKKEYELLYNMILLMVGIVEDLNLNTRIWSKS